MRIELVSDRKNSLSESKIAYYLDVFLEEHKEEIARMSPGSSLRVEREFRNPEAETLYSFVFYYIKGGRFTNSSIKVLLSGNTVATVRV